MFGQALGGMFGMGARQSQTPQTQNPWQQAQSIGPVPPPSFIQQLMQALGGGIDPTSPQAQQMLQGPPPIEKMGMMPLTPGAMMGMPNIFSKGVPGPSQGLPGGWQSIQGSGREIANANRMGGQNIQGMRPLGATSQTNARPLDYFGEQQYRGYLNNPMLSRR